MPVSICTPTFEHHRENLGIGESAPRISWRFRNSDIKNWIQRSYEMEISRPQLPLPGIETEEKKPPEIFKVQSSESVLVPWPSVPLRSREHARVRVCVIGSDGIKTPWSDFVDVETGLLDREDWSAQVIAPEKIPFTSGPLQPTLIRKSFQISKKVLRARLYITAYGVYEASINGVKVGDHLLAPGWTSYKHRLSYQTFDVIELLNEGDNGIGVEVGDGWYCGRLGFFGGKRDIYGDNLAVLAQLEVVYDTGEMVRVGSNASWKTSLGPIISSELYDGEFYDASLKIDNWTTSNFTDEEWKGVEVLDFPAVILFSPEGPPIRKTETLRYKQIIRSPTNKVIMDFGQNLVGRVHVRVSGPKGHKIVFTHTEVLEHGEVSTRPLRDCKQVDTLILNGKDVEWEPKFTFHGFQYVQVQGWPSETGEPGIEDIQASVIHTDLEPTGWFECSEPNVNQLYSNIRWGMRGNFVGIPTDCPQRDERLGWTGDIQIFAPTASFLFDTSGMLSGWLKDVAVEQIQDFEGVVPPVVPNVLPDSLNGPQAVWGDVAVITPWDLYLNFGDKNILEAQYESMKTWISSIPKGENGLWEPTQQQLGDWLDPAAPPFSPADGRTDPHFVANAYLVRITQLLSHISRTISPSRNESDRFKGLASVLKREFQHNYITPSGRLAPDTMTSLALALTFDLFQSSKHTDKARARLAELVRASRFRIATGFVGTPIILPALASSSSSEFKQFAYRMLLEKGCPSWLYPITMGATTMWERWDSMLPNGDINPGSMTSFNHYALGSVGKWLFSSVGGVGMFDSEGQEGSDGVGWRRIRFAPIPGGTITSAKTSHLSPYGLISCEWDLDVVEKIFKMSITIPPSSTAVVELPGKENTKPIDVGSGKWTFVVEGYAEKQVWPPKAASHPFSMFEDDELEKTSA